MIECESSHQAFPHRSRKRPRTGLREDWGSRRGEGGRRRREGVTVGEGAKLERGIAGGLATRLGVEILLLLLAPLAVYWGLRPVPVNQAGMLDPYFYTGYIHNFNDLIQRYDLTYYAVRFGLIGPGRLFAWMFGAEGGYFALRYVLALVACLPLYAFARRHLGRPVAALSYVALLSSPWFLRALLWEHPDATGVPFLLATMGLLLWDREVSWRDAAAGVCASMAVNSNLFTLAVAGIFGVAYAAVSVLYGTRWSTLWKRSLLFGAGFLAVLTGGWLYYRRLLGVPRNFFRPTLEIVQQLNGGGMKVWRIPGAGWVTTGFHVFVPVLIAACCVAVTVRRRMRFETAVIAASGCGVVGFFWVHQFLLSGDTLQLFYYFSYCIPSCFLMLACAWQALADRAGGDVAVWAWAAGMVAPWLVVANGARAVEGTGWSVWLGLAVATLAAVALGGAGWRRREWGGGLAVAAGILMGIAIACGLGGGRHGETGLQQYAVIRAFAAADALRDGDDGELSLYRLSLQVMESAPKQAEHPGGLLFWYPHRPHNFMDSLQSTYLWGYSRFNGPEPNLGLPALDAVQVRTLRDGSVRYLAMLGDSRAELEQGLEALRRAGVGYRSVERKELASGGLRVYWELVEMAGAGGG